MASFLELRSPKTIEDGRRATRKYHALRNFKYRYIWLCLLFDSGFGEPKLWTDSQASSRKPAD